MSARLQGQSVGSVRTRLVCRVVERLSLIRISIMFYLLSISSQIKRSVVTMANVPVVWPALETNVETPVENSYPAKILPNAKLSIRCHGEPSPACVRAVS